MTTQNAASLENYPLDADYLLRAYAPTNKGGHLVLVTWHRGETSKDRERDVLLSRRARGEIGHIELVDLKRHTTEQR